MMQMLAIAVIVPGMVWLLVLNWKQQEKVSRAFWIPLSWMLIVGSRSVSSWFNLQSGTTILDRFTEGTPLDAAIYAVLILCGLFVLNSRARQIDGFLRSNPALLVFFGYCAAAVLWSDFPLIALKHWIKLLGSLAIVLVVLTEANPWGAIRRLFSTSALILLPLSVLFILGFPELGSKFNDYDHLMYYNGVTTQKNELGMISLIFGLAALWMLLEDLDHRGRAGWRGRLAVQCSVLLMALWLIVMANSMTSLSSFMLSALVMVLVGRPWASRHAANAHLLAGSAVGLAVFALFIDSTGALLRMLGRNPTLTGRTDIWKAVLSYHTNPLIGRGFDSFWLGSRIEGVAHLIGYKGITQAHNGYIETYINLGWIGVALLGWLIASGYLRGVKMLRVDPSAGRFQVAMVASAIMYNLSEAEFRSVTLSWMVFLLAIVEIPALRPNRATRPVKELQSLRATPAKTMRILR
jgi:O-antigen ligase